MADYIRKAYQQISLSMEQTVEMARLMKRPTGVRRFIHYVDINTRTGPLNFGKVIKDFQFDMIDLFQNSERSMLLASRQMSKCIIGESKITVRDELTKEVFTLSIEDFHHSQTITGLLSPISSDGKFVESITVRDWSVMTDTGYETIDHTNKTVDYIQWVIETDNRILKCADNHIVFDENHNELFTKDIKVNQRIITNNGVETVNSITETNISQPMFDLSVRSANKRYYTDGILSHNTTIGAYYLLYEAVFPTAPGDILIVAHKQGHAMEVLKRMKDMYYSTPMWMKPGIVKNNETSVVFDNGMRVIAEATTSNAARGKSLKFVYCVDGNTKITIRNKITGEMNIIDIEDLYFEDIYN